MISILVLAAVTAAAPADTARIREAAEAVRAGIAHSTAGRPEQAASSYLRAAGQVPSFAPWAHMLAAVAVAKQGDSVAVRTHLARGDTALVREWGWRARVDAVASAGTPLAAARLAEAAAARITDAAQRADAWSRAGGLYAQASRPAEAKVALRNAIEAGIGTAGAVEAARVLDTLAPVSAEDQLRIGRVYMRHGNLARAATAIDAYRRNASMEQRTAVQLELGRAMFNARQYAGAETRLRAAASVSVPAARAAAAEALHMLGRTQYRRGRHTDARATLNRVTREHPGTEAAAKSHFILADLDHDARRIEDARTHYRAVISANGPDAALAAVRLGNLALLEGRARDAAQLYQSVHPRMRTRADSQQTAYWWARSLERAGARDSARLVLGTVRRIDPFSWYGLRAAELLDISPWEAAAAEPASVSAAQQAAITAAVDALDVLRQAGLEQAAAFEGVRLTRLYGASAGGLYALGRAYHARGQTARGVGIGRELLRREGSWNRRILELVYPMPFRDDIVRASRPHELDPWLVAGLIRQESMFNPRARSVAGALGLMQVMPATGTRVARQLGISGFNTSQLTTPSVNLRLGTRYLADQISSHRGRMVDAIAAYNAGPHRVAAWRAFPEYAETELFIERIPFEETREYVKIVQQNALIYRALYGGQ
ncbi:MAG TPA: transglycosylase SLT domain-containing protein [Longimicrobiales bacterium]|nr:transglycosylase SLT domain-containing protein [Longimicrobiales bacterium]